MTLQRLKVSAQDKPEGRFSAWTSKQVEDWLDAQPRADGWALGTALRDALLEINRAPLRKMGRFEALERLRPVVSDACGLLTARFRTSSLPLGEPEQAHADLVRQLYAELAMGYKILVNEQIEVRERGTPPPPGPNANLVLQLSIQRAILSLGRALVESYRVYAPEPPLLWRDLHTLYRNAEIVKLQALPIEGSRDAEETALSIKQAYLRVAVLAMANPYHLMQGEAEELYKRIGRWVHFVQLRPPASSEDLAGHFAIDLGSDFPARYVPRNAKLPPPAEPRVLTLDTLVAAIGDQIERANEILNNTKPETSLSARMQRDMYIRFREALGGRNERKSERKPTLAKLTVVEGLSACHFFLNGRRPFTPEQDEQAWSERLGTVAKVDSLRLVDDNEAKQDNTFNPSRGRASQFKAHDAEADDIWRKANMVNPISPQEGRQRKTRYQAAPWHRKNESEGGMALYCVEGSPMQVRVGELVTYAPDNAIDPSAWQIGTIRWLRTRANGGLELGVKHLAKNGFALGTKAVSGPGKGSEYLRAIMIPRVNPLVQSATIVTPAGVYDVGTVLQLNMKDLLIYARLTELIETTRLFAHFRFKVVEAPTRAPATKPVVSTVLKRPL